MALVPACGPTPGEGGSSSEESGSEESSSGLLESSSEGAETTSGVADESSTGSSSDDGESSGSTGDIEGCCGCLCADDHWSCSEETCVDAEGMVTMLGPEAGFFAIDSGEYVVDGTPLRSPHHRVWYSFRPAEESPEEAPVLLFFNGGPGFSTGPLFGFNTNAFTFDPDRTADEVTAPTAEPWTRFGNLLYVDAPGTGFSYPLTLEDGSQPFVGIDPDRDAAAFIRVLLRFLARHPDLRDNPIVIVGESYGGTRATLMVRHLLRYEELVDGLYRDPELRDEIAAHYEAVFGEGDDLEPSQITAQFGWQVIIQGLVGGLTQLNQFPLVNPPGCEQPEDRYQCDEAFDWSQIRDTAIAEGLLDLEALPLALGVDPTTIAWLHADARAGAYGRTDTGEVDESEWEPVFGELDADDRYYVLYNQAVGTPSGSGRNYYDDAFADEFLWNAAHVRTLFTDAGRDLVIWSPGLVPTLAARDAIVADIVHDTTPLPGVERPGRLSISLVPGAIAGVDAIDIRFPHYEEAGHMVTLRAPEDLLADVEDWWSRD